MKRTIAIILALVLVLGLAACGGGNAPANNGSKENTAPSGNDKSSAEDYYFQKGDLKIHMQDPAAPVLEKLGQAKSSYEAPSCAFDGMDVIYSYPGFDLMTYVKDGQGIVSGVVLRDDTVETIEGICIGSDKAAVEKAYGKFADGANNMKVVKGSCELLVILTDGVVSSIQYTPNAAK